MKRGLQTLGVRLGDEVTAVSNTAMPTEVAVDGNGATPILVDGTYRMDISHGDRHDHVPYEVYSARSPLRSMRGHGPLEVLAADYNLTIVDDCTQAHGTSRNGGWRVTMGDAARILLLPHKVLGAYGNGGSTITSRKDVDKSLRRGP